MQVVIPSKNEQPCDVVWVWLSLDKDGNEGICMGPLLGPDSSIPFVTCTERLVPLYDNAADRMARNTGVQIRRVRFDRAEVEKLFNP